MIRCVQDLFDCKLNVTFIKDTTNELNDSGQPGQLFLNYEQETENLIGSPVSSRLFRLLMTAGQPLLMPWKVFGSFSKSSGKRVSGIRRSLTRGPIGVSS